MTEGRSERLGRLVAWWVDAVETMALWVVVGAIAATGVIFTYTLKHFEIDTNLDSMLSQSLSFRRTYEDFKKAFPQDISTILLVIDGDTPERAQDASRAMAARLARETDLFKSAYVPGGEKFFEEHALLYLNPSEFDDLIDHLAKVQPFLAKLVHDPSLRGLFSLLTNAVEAVREREELELDLVPFFDRISEAIEAASHRQRYQISWQELMLGNSSNPDNCRRFVVAEPKLDFSKFQPAEPAMEAVHRLTKELNLDQNHGIRLRVTGDIALDYDELKTVSRGAAIATFFCFALTVILVFIAFGSLRLVLVSLVTLIFGLVWTGGFAIFVIGHLNLFSVTFAALYIGMAVDYSIHFCLRYKELLQLGMDHKRALSGAAQGVGHSLIIGTIILAMGFYAFLPTSFVGVSELGLITGTGMFIGLFATLTLLPALLHFVPPRPRLKSKGPTDRLMSVFDEMTSSHARAVTLIALVLGLAAIPFLTRITFDLNPLRLKDQTTESVSTFNELLAKPGMSPWTIMVLAENDKIAGTLSSRLGQMREVEKTVALDDFIPDAQDEKLTRIRDFTLVMGPDLLKAKPQAPPSDVEKVSALKDFQTKLESFLEGSGKNPLAASGRRLLDSLSTFNNVLKGEKPYGQNQLLKTLEANVIGSLPERLRAFQAALAPSRITIETLPNSLVERWVAKDGRCRIEVYPREDLSNDSALRHFVDAVRTVAPNITGFPVITLEAGNAVVRAFEEASFWSLLAIIFLLMMLLPRKIDTLLVLLPLVLAWLLTAAIMVLLHVQLNFTNVIDLPLLLSYGANSGIYMIYRARTKVSADEHLLQTSTTRAVIFCALTTFASFANLSVSRHPGLASMGQLLTLGLGFVLLCDLIVLPALLAYQSKRRGRI